MGWSSATSIFNATTKGRLIKDFGFEPKVFVSAHVY